MVVIQNFATPRPDHSRLSGCLGQLWEKEWHNFSGSFMGGFSRKKDQDLHFPIREGVTPENYTRLRSETDRVLQPI